MVQLAFGRLAQLVEEGRLSTKLSEVDLLLMACAEAHSLPIVTRDGPMAAACSAGTTLAKNVPLPDFFRERGWQFL